MTSPRTARWLFLVLLAASVTACGGNGGSEGDGQNAGPGQERDTGSGDGTGEGADPADIPAMDAANMPPAGEAHVTVDGQTFVFRQADMLEGPFACEIRADGVTINFQSDGHDLLIQGAGSTPADLRVNVIVAPEDGDRDYNSSNADYGGINFDATHLLYVGEFDAREKDDPVSSSAVGQGTVAVSCA